MHAMSKINVIGSLNSYQLNSINVFFFWDGRNRVDSTKKWKMHQSSLERVNMPMNWMHWMCNKNKN